MSDQSSTSLILQGFLDRLQNGDETARDELIAHTYDRLVVLTRRMLGGFSRLKAWEETYDVAQNAMMRLRRALETERPESLRRFYGLASLQIRRELLDLTRHHFGADGERIGGAETGKAPRTIPPRGGDTGEGAFPQDFPSGEATNDPGKLEVWRKFHEAVQQLPETEREVMELLWYQGLTQEEVAEILGVDKSTVKRRYRRARMTLSDVLVDLMPDGEIPAE